jgi:hypothetical protein
MIGNLLNELRARSAFGEAGDLSDIEEQGAQSVGRVCVEGLQTPSEAGVAVTVRPARRPVHLVARNVNTLTVGVESSGGQFPSPFF